MTHQSNFAHNRDEMLEAISHRENFPIVTVC
jgi:hypothetical protein